MKVGEALDNIGLDSEKIKHIFKQTLSNINSSKSQIFNISENVRNEYTSLREELDAAQSKLMVVMSQVSMFEKEVALGRKKLYEVNKDYDKYSEEIIEQVYDKVNNLVISLAEKREEEKALIVHRNTLEQRLKTYSLVLEDTEKIIAQISVAMDFLEGNLNSVAKSIDELNDKSFIGLQLIEALENERERIARDIHDGPAQSFANIALSIELIKKLIEIDSKKAIVELDTMKKNTKDNLSEIRKIIYDLKPFDISEIGLIDSIKFLVESFSENTKTLVNIKEISKISLKHDLINMTVFRIIRECMNNIKKYANATNVDIVLEQTDSFLNIVISDNGVGFYVSNISTESNHGFGLSSIKRQCKYLHASLKIQSAIGKGTKIAIRIPLEG